MDTVGRTNVDDILVFMAVVEAGSFVRGGKACGLSRSAAGKAVARLEERAGTRLLNRTTRALDLTDEGQRLYAHGEAIRAAVDAADASMVKAPGVPRGTLRITAPDALGRRLLLPTVARFLARWSEVQIELSFSDRVDSLVAEGFDLAIRIGVNSPDAGLYARTLLHDEAVLCAAPSYFAHRARPATADQLGLHDLLMFASRGERQAWRLEEPDGTSSRAQGRARLRMDSAEGLRDAAMAGLGIALLPRLVVGSELDDGRLERVLPHVKAGRVPVMALYPHQRLLEPRARYFIDQLVDDLAGG